jgi:glycosyltransferase involved in cell wall biosynthesis
MVNDKPRLSIGLPVFNGDNYLAEALDSLLAQTYSDFELIISDNASTDKTGEICQAYAARDKRIRYYRNETNLGGAYNDCRVVALARGEYFRWAGHDDICDPELLARCIEVLDQEPDVVLCYPKTTIIDEKGQFVEYYPDNFNLPSPHPHKRFGHIIGAKRLLNPFYGVIRANILKQTHLVEGYPASDRVLLGELALFGKFYEIPEYLFYRRVHPQKSTVVNVTDESMAAWFDPTTRGKLLVPRLRRFWGFLRAISHCRLNWSEQIRCYLEFGRFYLSIQRMGGAMRDLKQATYAVTHKFTQHKA